MSSAQIVGIVKRQFGVKKAGHTGTLDPAAAGVLPICLGRATKFSGYVMAKDKEYISEITFGIKTDTMDALGKIIEKDENADVSKKELKASLPDFIGKIEQTVPAFSAVKRNGQPLYKSALKNQVAELPKREINIAGIEILAGVKNRFLLRIKCSKGTYIRSLIEDIGKKLNTCAYTSFLLRTKSGNFRIEDSYTIDEIENCKDKNTLPVPVEDVLDDMPKLELKDYLFDIITTGSGVDLTRAGLHIAENKCYAIFCDNKFLGVGKAENNILKLNAHYYLRGQ